MFSRQPRTVAEPQAETTVASRHGPGDDLARSAPATVGPARAGHSLLELQRSLGNRHVQRVVERARHAAKSTPVIQPKLVVGAANDRCEREADRIADQVGGRVGPSPPASDAAVAGEVDPWIRQGIHNAAGGQWLPDVFRSSMEQVLGADLRGVRLHTDAMADRMNEALEAEAFTSGRHVFIRRAAYVPGSREGQSLLAHELTHVVQQGGTKVGCAAPAHGTIQRKMAFTSKRLKKDGKLLDAPQGQGVNTLFKKIFDNLKKYEQTSERDTELMRLQKLEVFANEWLATHAASTDPEVQSMTVQIKAMLPEVRTEIDALSTEQKSQYRGRAEATWRATQSTKSSDKGKHHPFEYITKTGATHMSLTAPKEMAALQDMGVINVTDEELAAIAAYTAGDYRYMNPVLANDTAWLSGVVPGMASGSEAFEMPSAVTSAEKGTLMTTPNKVRALKMEALQHARLAVSGLKKLPNAPTAVRYRGITLPEPTVTQYQKDAIVPFLGFTSTSTKSEVANLASRRVVVGEAPVSMTLTITHGKDVQRISHSKGEGEILVLPGAKFQVTKGATKNADGVWEVEMTQVAAGGDLTGFGTSATSAITNPASSSSSSSSIVSTTADTSPLMATPPLVPAYVASQGNSSSSSTTATSTGVSSASEAPTRTRRGEAVDRRNVFELRQSLIRGASTIDPPARIQILGLSGDRTQVQVSVIGDLGPPFFLGVTAVEVAIGRRLPTNF